MQNFARSRQHPIDTLHFEFEVTEEDFFEGEISPDGVHVNGIYIEGCQWDHQKSPILLNLEF